MTNYRNRFRDGNAKKLSSIDEIKKQQLFKNKNVKIITPQNEEVFLTEAESEKFVQAYVKQRARYIPDIDYDDPSTFCFFGSAERYYDNSIKHVYGSYPYDGSKAEKMEWAVSASFLDLYVFEHEYPKSSGHVNFVRSADTGGGTYYRTFQTPRYITFSGGPQVGTTYSVSKKREGNLKIDGTPGNTIEFWMRKDAGTFQTAPRREVIFDVASSAEGSSAATGANYGRITVELQNPLSSTASPFMLVHRSGSTGTSTGGINFGQRLGSSNVTTASVADGKWHHYAVTTQTSGSRTVYKLYIDGELDHETSAAYTIGAVDTPMTGAIGALSTYTSADGHGGIGQGQLSASIDEVRFWKEARTDKEIGRFWYHPIHGGTDKDHTNANLGLYYKFNEGVTSVKEHDEVILDYSGRINNGKFVNWNSTVRSTESGIDLSEYLPESGFTEVKDPIINPSNSRISTVTQKLKDKGKSYDVSNGSSLIKSVPSHLQDDDDKLFPELLQIMASSFDELFVKIKHLPSMKNYDYKEFFKESGQYRLSQNSGFLLGCEDEILFEFTGDYTKPWMNHTLEHYGMISTEIFPNATIFENFFNRTEKLTFDYTLDQVKKEILSNIHKNLVHIFKTKGTETSFRNLIRCFGVDDELIKLNSYANNQDYILEKKPNYTTIKQKSISFEGQNYQGTLYNTSSVTESLGYITGSSHITPFTIEANIMFPKKVDQNQVKVNPASLFGMHSVDGATGDNGPLTFNSEDSGSMQVKFVKRKIDSEDGYFELTSSAGVFAALTSSYIPAVYDNSHWNVSVRVGAKSDIDFNIIPSTANTTYLIEFTGYNYDLDILKNSFSTNTSISKDIYEKISQQDKGVFVGSHKTNFSGSHLMSSDVRVLGFNMWKDCLTEDELKEHAKNPETYGRTKPQSISNFDTGNNLLSADSLILRWQFQNLTASNDSNQLSINDFSSGSSTSILDDEVSGFQQPGLAISMVDNSNAIFQEFIPAVRYAGIDNVYSSDRVKVKTLELDKFEADSRPVTYHYNFEKSMYQIVSQEMMSFFAGVTGYNNMIGEPVNKYREKYKLMEKVRQRFFLKVNNDMDLDKFIEYYKWVDESLSHFLEQLKPASANFGSGIKDIVESHILERNKYRHKAPTIEFKDPAEKTFSILGINELLYDWEHGHAPIDGDTDSNCLWQKERAERDIANEDERETIRRISITEVSGSTYALRKLVKPYKFSGENFNTVTTGRNRKANKNTELYKVINSGKSVITRAADLESRPRCKDVIDPNELKLYSGKTNTTNTDGYLDADSDLMLPFDFVSSSGVRDLPDLKSDLEIVNNLTPYDMSGEKSLKGPFAETHIGGMPHNTFAFRNTISSATDDNNDRPEAYILNVDNAALTMSQVPAHKPKSMFYNDVQGTHFANIKNIKHDTSSVSLGNFNKLYEVVMTNGRSSNNAYLTDREGRGLVAFESPTTSNHLDGAVDFRVPNRGRTEHVIVNKFSSPGSPESMSPVGLDRTAEEFSIYSTLNYRNSIVRDMYDFVSAEHSVKHGYRSVTASSSTATITFTGDPSVNQTIIITSADGTSLTYTAKSSGNSAARTFDCNNGVTTSAATLKAAIEDSTPSAGGHAGKILVSNNGSGKLTLTQTQTGPSNNTSIVNNLSNTTVTGFAEGTVTTETIDVGDNYIGSLHKTNRNPTRMAYGDDNFDNFFVQHHIPQNDFSYSWINASVDETLQSFLKKNNNHGHQHNFGIPGILKSSQTINFVTASQMGYGGYESADSYLDTDGIFGYFGSAEDSTMAGGLKTHGLYPVDIAGLNTIIIQEVNDSDNTIGSTLLGNYINHGNGDLKYPLKDKTGGIIGFTTLEHPEGALTTILTGSGGIAPLLNSIILNRQGPYGWPTWKQIRTSQHAISRRQRQDNIISLSVRDTTTGTSTEAEELFPSPLQEYYHSTNKDLANLDYNQTVTLERRFRRYSEIMATGRFNPLTITLHGGTASDLTVGPISQTQHEGYWINDETSLSSLGSAGVGTIAPNNTRLASIKATYGNDVTAFANTQLTRKLKIIDKVGRSETDSLLINLGEAAAGPEINSTEVNYIETLYPREINTYTKQARIRENFDFFPWRVSRVDREHTLSGSVTYSLSKTLLIDGGFQLMPHYVLNEFEERNSNSLSVDAVDIDNLTNSTKTVTAIVTSRWPLDARKDFSSRPINITNSFFNNGTSFLDTKDCGTRGEGVLQNDYSIFALGYNALHGTPPPSMVYNRRIPQMSSSADGTTHELLAGEAKWLAAEQSGYYPFPDSFDEHSEDFRQIGQDHSLVPEFKISDHVENVLSSQAGDFNTVRTRENYLSVTGAVYDKNTQDVQISNKFFKTYGTSDFMKYFGVVSEKIEEANLGSATKMTLRCKAAIKFTPYEGFYPAERVLQIGNIFSRGYMGDFDFNVADPGSNEFVPFPDLAVKRKIRANLQQSMKPLFAPGILMNSIKTGMAVDYPLFGSATDTTTLKNYTAAVANKSLSDANFLRFDDELNALTMFTGSLVNHGDAEYEGDGVPRLSGSVHRRVTFEDLLNPENLDGVDIIDQEPHPSASIYYADRALGKVFDYPFKFGKLNSTNNLQNLLIRDFKLKKNLSDGLKPYRMAINNFCAETVRFFLKDGSLSTLESEPVYPYLKANEEYKMRVYVRNNNTRMYDRHSAFGAPVDEGPGVTFVSSSLQTVTFPSASATATVSSYLRSSSILGMTFYFTKGFQVTGSALTNNSYDSLPHFAITSSTGQKMRVSLFNSIYFEPWTHHGFTSGALADRKDHMLLDSSDVLNKTGLNPSDYGDIYHHSASSTLNLYIDLPTIENAGTSGNDDSAEVNNLLFLIQAGVNYYGAARPDSDSSNQFGVSASISSANFYGGRTLTLHQAVVGTAGNTPLSPSGMDNFVSVVSSFSGGNPEITTLIYETGSTTVNNSHGYAPFVPPYLDPGSEPYVEISFTPAANESRHYGLQEILDNSTYTYYNFAETPSNASDNTNYQQAMAISASLDLKKFVVYNLPGDRPSDQNRTERYRWVIQPKWETPVLNFIDAEAAALNLNNNTVVTVTGSNLWQKRRWENYYNFEIFESPKDETSGTYLTSSIGMWHQYGRLPISDEEGYTISVEKAPGIPDENQLSKKVGFEADKGNTAVQVGRLTDKKVVSEAVIAIPFIEPKAEGGAIEFFNIKQHILERAYLRNVTQKENLQNILSNPSAGRGEKTTAKREYQDFFNNPGQNPIDSAAYQMRMMEKFIIPPQFDYMSSGILGSNNSVKPMMYVFQFNAEFTKEDLRNIWQNLSPQSKTSAAKLRYSTVNLQSKIAGQVQDVQYVSNFLDERLCPFSAENFLGSDKVRWLIFKVKQRASFDLAKVKRESLPALRKDSVDVEISSIEPTKELQEQNYSYNWPYDFFSIVELIKFESKVDFFSGVDFAEVEEGNTE